MVVDSRPGCAGKSGRHEQVRAQHVSAPTTLAPRRPWATVASATARASGESLLRRPVPSLPVTGERGSGARRGPTVAMTASTNRSGSSTRRALRASPGVGPGARAMRSRAGTWSLDQPNPLGAQRRGPGHEWLACAVPALASRSPTVVVRRRACCVRVCRGRDAGSRRPGSRPRNAVLKQNLGRRRVWARRSITRRRSRPNDHKTMRRRAPMCGVRGSRRLFDRLDRSRGRVRASMRDALAPKRLEVLVVDWWWIGGGPVSCRGDARAR